MVDRANGMMSPRQKAAAKRLGFLEWWGISGRTHGTPCDRETVGHYAKYFMALGQYLLELINTSSSFREVILLMNKATLQSE
ncbi:hypothetical protein NKH34_14995 [Mesorhizobium sp. M1148]|uniref:hypothetical protein n=1 Tax=unclassified Mesorhizobium TaxID=325217 RepID=UPI003338AEF4